MPSNFNRKSSDKKEERKRRRRVPKCNKWYYISAWGASSWDSIRAVSPRSNLIYSQKEIHLMATFYSSQVVAYTTHNYGHPSHKSSYTIRCRPSRIFHQRRGERQKTKRRMDQTWAIFFSLLSCAHSLLYHKRILTIMANIMRLAEECFFVW